MSVCRACSHPDRAAIDQKIVNGVSLRALCTAHGLSLGGLSRHRRHVKDALNQAIERTAEERAAQGESLVDRVEELIGEARDICRLAKADKSYAAASNALNAAMRSLELVGRLTGQLAQPNALGLHLAMSQTITTVNTDAISIEELSDLIDHLDPHEFQQLQRLVEQRAAGEKPALLCTVRATESVSDENNKP